MILSFILSLSAIIITLKILVGYNPEFSFRRKMIIAVVVVFAWFCPTISGMIRWLKLLPAVPALYVSQGLYVLFVTAMFLLGILLIRDLFWIHGYQIAQKLRKTSPDYDPMKPEAIKKANVAAVVAALLLSGYSLYQGLKFPAIRETTIVSDKIERPVRIVALTDLHITPATSVSFVEKMVRTVNKLRPDMIALIGDIVDAKPSLLKEQMNALSKLEAKLGVFATLGNHEFYHGSLDWAEKFKKAGFSYLENKGLMLNEVNVYLSGLPDPQMLMISPRTMKGIEATFKAAPEGAYRVFLSHSPRFIEKLSKDFIDLQISGHTHGGQIFPFHFFVKRFNRFVSGLYDVEGMKLYVSRGAGGWGPPMRLFAPSEISLIMLVPPQNKNATD